jgi:hypothetical protein
MLGLIVAASDQTNKQTNKQTSKQTKPNEPATESLLGRSAFHLSFFIMFEIDPGFPSSPGTMSSGVCSDVRRVANSCLCADVA